MPAPSSSSKKQRTKALKSRPVATSTISQPAVEDAWSSSILSSFSPESQLFALLSLSVDKHRLRIFDASTSRAVAEHVVEHARVTSLAWISYQDTDRFASKENSSSPSKKRKKVGNSSDITSEKNQRKAQAVALGLSDGNVLIFSVVHGRTIQTLVHNLTKVSVTAITRAGTDGPSDLLWASYSDGCIRLWDVQAGKILLSVQNEDQAPYSALATRPGMKNDETQLLAATKSIYLLSSSTDSSTSDDSDVDNLKQICTIGGHASPVRSLIWDETVSPSKRIYSSAEEDRYVYVWEVPDTSSKGKMVASCPLDSEVRQIDLSTSSTRQILLTLATSGKILLYPVPAELSITSGTKGSSKHQLPTLLPRCTITLSSKSLGSDIRIVSATFLPSEKGKLRIALLSGGAKVAFETLEFLDNNGEFIHELTLTPNISAFKLTSGPSDNIVLNQRYSESSTMAVATGAEISHDPSLDANVDREVEGDLDANFAELSLGQRLAARATDVTLSGVGHRSGSDVEEDEQYKKGSEKRKKLAETTVPAHSLTRTLIQALHAGDNSLLEACLAHSDEALIRNTITRLPPQLAIPLITACVERLGRGARGNGIKGGGGAASAQRGMALVKWIRAVLIIHSAHLMTMPDLVARLSHLYSTLTTRLTLQERLLSLSGKLDLVLTQVELRSSNAPAPVTSGKKKTKKRGTAKREPTKYIEGESTDEEQMQVEVESDDDLEGSIEDIELGRDSDEDSEDEDEEGDSDEDDDDEDNLMNGFIDDEAEEDYEEDESEEDSE